MIVKHNKVWAYPIGTDLVGLGAWAPATRQSNSDATNTGRLGFVSSSSSLNCFSDELPQHPSVSSRLNTRLSVVASTPVCQFNSSRLNTRLSVVASTPVCQ